MTDEGNKMTYLITHNYGKCPNQIEGHTDEGTHFYFRGRHNGWSLGFGETVDDAIKNNDYYGDLYGAGGLKQMNGKLSFGTSLTRL